MKLKKAIGVLSVLSIGVLSLASCGETTEPAGTITTTVEPSTTVKVDKYLSFVSDNKIRVDIMDSDLGVSFKYGNAQVVDKHEMDYSSSVSLTKTGELNGDTINFIVVVENDTQSVVLYNPQVLKDSLDEYLGDVLQTSLTNVKKVYVAVSKGTVKWTKNLNAELDAKINSLSGFSS